MALSQFRFMLGKQFHAIFHHWTGDIPVDVIPNNLQAILAKSWRLHLPLFPYPPFKISGYRSRPMKKSLTAQVALDLVPLLKKIKLVVLCQIALLYLLI